jgi:3-mercaptopyruvate sulfurtransferase SseA
MEELMMKKSTCSLALFLVLMSWLFVLIWAQAGDFPLIKPEEVKKMVDEGRADFVVVDSQPKEAYNAGHIPGAISFPWAIEIRNAGSLPKDKLLILYCACEHEEDATDVANQLMKKFDYNNIKLLEGGWSQWVKSGYQIEKGVSEWGRREEMPEKRGGVVQLKSWGGFI